MKQRHSELKKYLFGVLIALLLTVGLCSLLYVFRDNIAFFSPAGAIAKQQRDLFLFAFAIMLLIVVPVFFMLFHFAWKFRESNTTVKYRPEWESNNKLEALWWGIPIAIIAILGTVTWITSHTLDPYRPIASDKPALEVQVVALQWKWLFIYKEQGIASVNELHIPTDRPVKFTITSDAPMNSFWIPKLGSQIYAMAGMSTKLNLIADKQGTYEGVSANISGEGFADMKFAVLATTQTDFDTWSQSIARLRTAPLSQEAYIALAKKSIEKQPLFYPTTDPNLYTGVVNSYMRPNQITQAREAN